jgi:hypothetical protein
LWQLPTDETLKGKRDRAILSLACSVVGFVVLSWLSSHSITYNGAKTIGWQSISSGRPDTFGLFGSGQGGPGNGHRR